MDAEVSFEPPTTSRLSGNRRHVISPADRFIEAMEGRDPDDQRMLATLAPRHDPGCIKARLVLADHSQDLATRLRHLETAVAAGEWLWTQVDDRPEVSICWWGDVGTRPYMQSLKWLGMTLKEAGHPDESRACFERLLTMNPNDNQGIRFLVQDAPS